MEALNRAIADVRARYVAANPRSQAADREAERFLPGGNTRSVLFYPPFPVTMVSGDGPEMRQTLVLTAPGSRVAHEVESTGSFSAGH